MQNAIVFVLRRHCDMKIKIISNEYPMVYDFQLLGVQSSKTSEWIAISCILTITFNSLFLIVSQLLVANVT